MGHYTLSKLVGGIGDGLLTVDNDDKPQPCQLSGKGTPISVYTFDRIEEDGNVTLRLYRHRGNFSFEEATQMVIAIRNGENPFVDEN